MQGDKIVQHLTVSQSGATVRIAAGQYVVEIDGPTDRMVIEDNTVELLRGGRVMVRIVKDESTPVDGPGEAGPSRADDTARSELGDVGNKRRIPFRVRSRDFQGDDDVTIESLVELSSQSSSKYYEVRGRYRLQSRAQAALAQWCANGTLAGGNRRREVQRGEGAFRFTFSVVRSGDLHISFYPTGGGDSFGSIYYEPTRGPLDTENKPSLSQPRTGSAWVPDSTTSGWTTAKSELFRIHHDADLRADAEQFHSYLEKAVEHLRTECGDNRVKDQRHYQSSISRKEAHVNPKP
jgi:hypothetical protein